MVAPVNPRLKSSGERPPGPLVPKPANDNVLGTWEDGVFHFASPEAQTKWRRKSYEQGVSEDNWHLGKEIDPESAAIAQAGFGGANPGLYLAPDGTYRLMNAKTIESQEARDHRNLHLQGKKMDHLLSATNMPGVDEWLAKWKVARVANDGGSRNSNDRSAQSPAQNQSEVTERNVPALRPYEGRSGFQGATQGGRDAARGIADAFMGDSIEELNAGVAAAEAWLNGGSVAQTYTDTLSKEESESLAAEERLGLWSQFIKFVVGATPVVGDASGAVADIKDYLRNGDEWTPADKLMALAGTVTPFLGRAGAKSSKELVEGLVEKAKSLLKREGEELLDDSNVINRGDLDSLEPTFERKNSLDQYLPNNGSTPLTQQQAEALTGRNRGLIYVTETFTGKEPAKTFHDGTSGAFSSVEHKKRVVPALRYDNPDGKNFVKFDGAEVSEDGSQLLLIDAKRSLPIWKPSAMNDLKGTLERIKKAVHQNNADGLNGVQYKVVYEFPNRYTAKVAAMFLASSGYGDLISVRVRQ